VREYSDTANNRMKHVSRYALRESSPRAKELTKLATALISSGENRARSFTNVLIFVLAHNNNDNNFGGNLIFRGS